MSSTEGRMCCQFILQHWDLGALRTWWAYYNFNLEYAELCLLHYFILWYNDHTHMWTCKHPSAAAVHTVRDFWFNSEFSSDMQVSLMFYFDTVS